jgi:uncharacterized membrane protein YccC
VTPEAITPPREPFLILPGFAPEAMGFALRTTVALLLAYFIAFWAQLESASSAGLCVAIVAQSSPGMAMSKAIYRVIGTLLGGVVAVALVSAFAQDRTMLLAGFTIWLGLCTFVAALLRDFRSYGAVLCGYTVGIIAVSNIDAPQNVLLVTLDRVAAILLGVACVALVNTTLNRSVAFEALVSGLQRSLASMITAGRTALGGKTPPNAMTCVRDAAEILALTTQASYAATELPDGLTRTAGARTAIAGLLSMLSALRGVSFGLAEARGRTDPALTAYIAERTSEFERATAQVQDGLAVLETGSHATAAVRLSRHYDVVGAALSAVRTMLAVGLGAIFCILSGWAGTTGLLVQQAAFTALLGMQPNPTAAASVFGLSLPLPALIAGIVGFVLLPHVSGFVPFALAVGPCVFVFALLGQHPRTAAFGPGFMLYFTLLLAPSNPESYNLSTYVNTLLIQAVTILFMVLAFRLILPVSRQRRLYRVAVAIKRDLQRTLRHGRGFEDAPRQSLKYDRLAIAQQWVGHPTPARLAVFERLHAFAELDTALRRAWSGLDAVRNPSPALAAAVATARTALLQHKPAPLEDAAAALLAQPEAAQPDITRAISGLYGARILLGRQARALRQYRIVEDEA